MAHPSFLRKAMPKPTVEDLCPTTKRVEIKEGEKQLVAKVAAHVLGETVQAMMSLANRSTLEVSEIVSNYSNNPNLPWFTVFELILANFQAIGVVRELMRQQAHLLHRFKAADKVREFATQELSGSSKVDLSSALDGAREDVVAAKAEAAVAKKKAKEGVGLLQQAEFKTGNLSSKLSSLTAQHEALEVDHERLQTEFDQLAVGKMDEDNEIAHLRATLKESQKALEAAQEKAKSEEAKLQEDF